MNLQDLKNVLPSYLQPGNVGKMGEVTWPFSYSVGFDFGASPTWTPTTKQVQSFQVSQEAGLLLMALRRKSNDASGDLSPLQVELRDRQSSRQFNDRPIPMQNIGKKFRPTIFPTPMLLFPNAFLDVTITSWLTTGSQTSTSDGKFNITFFGYRIRTEDLGTVLSSVFGK